MEPRDESLPDRDERLLRLETELATVQQRQSEFILKAQELFASYKEVYDAYRGQFLLAVHWNAQVLVLTDCSVLITGATDTLRDVQTSQRRFYVVTKLWAAANTQPTLLPLRLFVDSTKRLPSFFEEWTEILADRSLLAVNDNITALFDDQGRPPSLAQ